MTRGRFELAATMLATDSSEFSHGVGDLLKDVVSPVWDVWS